MAAMTEFISGPALLVLMLGVGLYLSFRLKFFQITRFADIFKRTLGSLFVKEKTAEQSIKPSSAFFTALSGAVGVGNIAGVATALVSGGPGAIFWMWIAAFLGMAIKYAEIALGVRFREKAPGGGYQGGPDITIANAMKMPWLGALFAFFCTLAAFGVGNTAQANALAGSLMAAFGIHWRVSGAVCAALLFLVSAGGLRRICSVTGALVPFMAILYIAGALAALFICRERLPEAFLSIFRGAFSAKSAISGSLGYSVAAAVRFGVTRGLFTNEAGLGNAAIVHGAAEAKSPHSQGLWGVMEVFIDTIVVCTLTALVLLASGAYPHSGFDGAQLSLLAFNLSLGRIGSGFVAVSTALFAFSAMLGWMYYGERTACRLFGQRARHFYRAAFCFAAYAGSGMSLTAVWGMSDFLNAMMAIPNLVSLLFLSKYIIEGFGYNRDLKS